MRGDKFEDIMRDFSSNVRKMHSSALEAWEEN
jgi:hypothetical protein